jgi:hypothetical protein
VTGNGADDEASHNDEEERVTFPWAERSRGIEQLIDTDTDPVHKALMTSLTDFLDRAAEAPWQVTVTWRFTDEEALPVAVEVRSNSGPITASAWRTIRIQEVIDASRRRLSTELQLEALEGGFGPDVTPELAGEVFEERSRLKRSGRPRRYSDEFLAEVARVYTDAVAHQSTRPVREVAEHFTHKGWVKGGSELLPDAKNWVGQARQRGFIARGREVRRPK